MHWFDMALKGYPFSSSFRWPVFFSSCLFLVVCGYRENAILILTIIDFSNPLEQILKNYVLYLPFSRLCESEADHIGLLLMARACYHPSAAISLWKRMQMVQSAAGSNLPSFLSTHPSSEDRIAQIQKWMPEAERAYNDSCPSAFAGFPLPK